MGKWISDTHLDLILDEIVKSDREVVCSAQPNTFFNAVWPDLWVQETIYSEGDVIHPPSINGYVYECTTPGTSGAIEPGWTTLQDSTFNDGSVTWKAHENYSLASHELSPGDVVKSNGDIDGRKVTVAQKIGVVTHAAGTVSHTALLEVGTKTLHFVTEAQTTLSGDNDVIAGRTTIFFEFNITIREPV
jgi:hypothetical protein